MRSAYHVRELDVYRLAQVRGYVTQSRANILEELAGAEVQRMYAAE